MKGFKLSTTTGRACALALCLSCESTPSDTHHGVDLHKILASLVRRLSYCMILSSENSHFILLPFSSHFQTTNHPVRLLLYDQTCAVFSARCTLMYIHIIALRMAYFALSTLALIPLILTYRRVIIASSLHAD